MSARPRLPESREMIGRRDALRRVSALMGGALIGSNALLGACAAPRRNEHYARDGIAFTQAGIELLDEIAETILPETETPGAKAAGVGPFMALMVTDAYSPDEQRTFHDGMRILDEECLALHGVGFMDATPNERLSLLQRLDLEQKTWSDTREPDQPEHWFRMMKELALLGYFTSEVGYTQAMRYAETPGRYDPCVPYTPGDRAWAEHA